MAGSPARLPPLTGRRRLEQLAAPSRPVPLAATLLNPERRARMPAQGPASVEAFIAPDNAPEEELPHRMLRNSSSLPVLPVVRSSRDCGAEHYKRASATIFGGLDYQRKQQQRHKSLSSRFLDFKLKGGEQAEERNRRRKMENVRKLMREASRLFQKADANHDGTLDFNEFCELVQMQAVLQRRCDALSREPGRADSSGAAPFPSRTMLRDWFHLIDFDHSGVLGILSLRETLAV